jgi:hypothetical protein
VASKNKLQSACRVLITVQEFQNFFKLISSMSLGQMIGAF